MRDPRVDPQPGDVLFTDEHTDVAVVDRRGNDVYHVDIPAADGFGCMSLGLWASWASQACLGWRCGMLQPTMSAAMDQIHDGDLSHVADILRECRLGLHVKPKPKKKGPFDDLD